MCNSWLHQNIGGSISHCARIAWLWYCSKIGYSYTQCPPKCSWDSAFKRLFQWRVSCSLGPSQQRLFAQRSSQGPRASDGRGSRSEASKCESRLGQEWLCINLLYPASFSPTPALSSTSRVTWDCRIPTTTWMVITETWLHKTIPDFSCGASGPHTQLCIAACAFSLLGFWSLCAPLSG